jgi:hypothetical protein
MKTKFFSPFIAFSGMIRKRRTLCVSVYQMTIDLVHYFIKTGGKAFCLSRNETTAVLK